MKTPTNISWDRLENVELLASSEKSIIYKATFNEMPVVVKTINPQCDDDIYVEDLETELAILSKLRHKNIIELYGAGYTPDGDRFLILEYLEGGTLSQIMTRKSVSRYPIYKRKQTKFKMEDALIYARSIADALAYCQNLAILNCMVLHRDLKPENIAFSSSGVIKLMDFGLATVMKHTSSTSNEVYMMSGETGSPRYMAPEVAMCKPYNHKVDVYSFGIMLWEMLTLKKPYYDLESNFFQRVIRNGARPTIDNTWPEDLIMLLETCWSSDIDERPTFEDIISILDSVICNIFCNEESCISLTSSFHGVTKKKIKSMIKRHSFIAYSKCCMKFNVERIAMGRQ